MEAFIISIIVISCLVLTVAGIGNKTYKYRNQVKDIYRDASGKQQQHENLNS